MKRGLLAAYGLSVYAIFLGAFAVFIGFIENLGPSTRWAACSSPAR
jgi:hypothetical protein